MKYAFRYDGKAFILKAEDGSTVRIGPRHEKYDYVQGVDAGRVIGISKSGRWTNAKDYDDLYDNVSFGKSKPAASTKSKAAKAKPAAKSAAKSKSSTATKKKANSASKADTKRIQELEGQLSTLKEQVHDLKQLLGTKMKFLVSAFNGLSLDRPEATQNGSSVHAWSAHGQVNQAWYYSDGVIRSAENPEFCLDIEGGKYVNGTQVQLWKYHGGPNQKWVLKKGVLRSYGNPDFCLDIDANCQGENGGRIQLWRYENGKYLGGRNQTWEMLTEGQLAKQKQTQLAAARKTSSRPKPSKPKGKRRVVEAKAHVDLNWWNRKDYYLDPGGRGSSDFDVRIECVKKHEYTRLTKSMIKDAITSALEDSKSATKTHFNGWRVKWPLVYGLNMGGYDSKKGVRVRVLSIENTEYATIG